MSPNPTVRPFVAGALLFLALLGFWPSHASAPVVDPDHPASAIAR